jgi:hypothetical protein
VVRRPQRPPPPGGGAVEGRFRGGGGPPPEGGPLPLDGRPKITITTREDLVNAEATAALEGDTPLYQRGGLLVRVVRDDADVGRGIRRPVAPRIDLLPQPLLREKLAERARWVTEKETKEGVEERPAHPPGWCVAVVHVRASYPGVRHLEAIVDHPVLRPDGTVLCRTGYDPARGLILETNDLLDITEEAIDRIDPRAARDELLEVVVDFPFDRPAHRSAWLAALLTALARFAFEGCSPLFLADANAPGAGKGLLFHIIAWVLRGMGFTSRQGRPVEVPRRRQGPPELAGLPARRTQRQAGAGSPQHREGQPRPSPGIVRAARPTRLGGVGQ